MTKFEQIRNLKTGDSLRWDNPPMCCAMISEHLATTEKQFSVIWICTNWEASQGHVMVTRLV